MAEKIIKLPSLSVFFPAFNEAENIAATVNQAAKILPQVAQKWEIIVIDDGSHDNTALLARKAGAHVINHPKNLGYGEAIKTGLKSARYEYICQSDSDGQFRFAEIKKFIPLIYRGYHLVIGYRVKRTDNPYRRLMARILHFVGVILFGINVKDVDCGFKLFKHQVVTAVGPLKTSSAITVTEFITRAHQAGFKIAEVGVQHHSRSGGIQTGGRPSVIIKAAVQGIKLWLLLLKES